MNIKDYLVISEEVQQALDANKPVVALESTIISHGMPFPENVDSALTSEKTIRDNGAIPATIGIIKGKLKVGLTKEEIEYMGKDSSIRKASRRDLPVMVALGYDGATTVTTTMMIAKMAGIKVFATGGIGGVHRYAQETFDVSADLEELASTEVAVVCAGAKSILDIGLTLEYLETNGVPVLGYQTEDFPGFYTRKSGFEVDYSLESPEEIAKVVKTKWDLGLKGGAVVCNPIPLEYEMDYDYITSSINAAIELAKKEDIHGKKVTPFVLAYLHEKTENKSLKSNKQLVYNNCTLAAKLASALSAL